MNLSLSGKCVAAAYLLNNTKKKMIWRGSSVNLFLYSWQCKQDLPTVEVEKEIESF